MKLVCKVTRGKEVESFHEVYAVALDEEGKIILSIGNPDYITCIRSALKPFQASAAIAEGATDDAGFISEEIALMCASHNGEKIHVETAMAMANKLGFNLTHYECGSHPPPRQRIKRRGKKIKHHIYTTPQQLLGKAFRDVVSG